MRVTVDIVTGRTHLLRQELQQAVEAQVLQDRQHLKPWVCVCVCVCVCMCVVIRHSQQLSGAA
jgi:23S rRNA-/tRNA-specific pseudouridylate synthase